MNWKMAENSLFAVLLRSQWWWSVLVAAGVFGVVRLFMAWGYALFATSPFIVIAAMRAWRTRHEAASAASLRASRSRLDG